MVIGLIWLIVVEWNVCLMMWFFRLWYEIIMSCLLFLSIDIVWLSIVLRLVSFWFILMCSVWKVCVVELML